MEGENGLLQAALSSPHRGCGTGTQMLESLGMVVHALLILQRQMDLCEFEASVVYILSSRTARAT